jgi:hypothetical protein
MTSSVEQYPDTGFFVVVTGSETPMGSFVCDGGELDFFHTRFFHKKTGAFSYNLKLQVSTSLTGAVLAESETVTFDNDLIGQTTELHLADVVFSFPERYTLLDGETYFVKLVQTGYTRPSRPNENDSYLAFWCNWGEPFGSNTSGAKLGVGVFL